jgi:RimJ/RimL family protein N-acetyltransferase
MKPLLPPGFETERLVLRESTASDAPAIFAEYATDSAVTRFLTWPPHRSLADTETYLAACEAARHEGRSNTYVLIPRGGGTLLGAFDLRIETPFRISFGYVLARRHWGRGLMTEALRAALGWAQAQPGVWRVWAVCDVGNHGSARVMEKAGLEFECVLRRWIMHPSISETPRDCRAYAWIRPA